MWTYPLNSPSTWRGGRGSVVAVAGAQLDNNFAEDAIPEAGYSALEPESLVGLFGPHGVPSELRERIAAIFGPLSRLTPAFSTRLAATGQIVNVRGPVEFSAGIEDQRAKLGVIAETLGIKSAQ
jgi:tripartite-type tricarboxylate transporter receptor subunit TctC